MHERIGLVGRKGHGKDTVAQFLVEQYGFRRFAFADPIKDMLHAGLGVPYAVLHGDADLKERIDPRYGVSVRHMLTTLGTEWGRAYVSDDVWVRIALGRIVEFESERGRQRWVASDVRFENEAAALRDAGFVLVRVVRPEYVTMTRECESHRSETDGDKILVDMVVENASTVQALHLGLTALLHGVV